MKVFAQNRMVKNVGEGLHHMPHEHMRVGRPLPPHERKAMLHIEFGDDDLLLLNKVFGDADTAQAVADIIMDAPPEIQILAVQIMKMIEEVN